MRTSVLIVEDEFVEANNLQLILERAGYDVAGIAFSVTQALGMIEIARPDLVLLDIYLKGKQTGIDLAKILRKDQIAFVYLSANSNTQVLTAAKKTEPYGFLVKPFREKDVLITLDIAHYLHEQKLKLIPQIKAAPEKNLIADASFNGIVGNSVKLQQVLHLVKIVAPTDTSVLVLGESGTGKEKIVNNIHENSLRKGKPFITVNCAALPATLIESELFGHERGSFTGADERRTGKFEMAAGGTIFLDEIGELPFDIQAKLLRVLQEKEIERVGGKNPISVDVRIIAATNRILEKEVAEGKFRMDLYYRLNVFPVFIPPLRERKEDIPALVNYFMEHFSSMMNRPSPQLSEEALNSLAEYSWPGNIRELEHVIERTLLLNSENEIENIAFPEAINIQSTAEEKRPRFKTMEETETEIILEAIRLAKGKLSGTGGAAELLDIPYSTLTTKIKKLGIKKLQSFNPGS